MRDDKIHVVPLNDLREHDTSIECWCKPTVNEDDIVIHHALDDRESYESGRRLQ